VLVIAASRGDFDVALSLRDAGALPSSRVAVADDEDRVRRPGHIAPSSAATEVDVATMDRLFWIVTATPSDRPAKASRRGPSRAPGRGRRPRQE
jgi:hypothetical protein